MNLCGSLPNHENRNVYDGTSPQGLSEARRAGFFFELFVTDPPRGRPFGGGGDHRTWRSVKKISYHTRIVQFSWENAQFQAETLKGASPPTAVAPRCDNSRPGATSSSLSAGAAWGDRHCPLLHSYQHLEFHINGKGILQSRNTMNEKITGYIDKQKSPQKEICQKLRQTIF